ncbi:hypothetical protein QUS88_22535 [Xanthomonas citri pv. citri]
MIKMVKIAVQIAWAVSIISLCMIFGFVYGWTHHAWLGAFALGTVGLVAGALLAASPLAFLQILSGGL